MPAFFVSDKTNFWNLYRYSTGVIEAIYPMDAEFGLPLWVFGMSTYAFIRFAPISAPFLISSGISLIDFCPASLA